MNKKQQIRIGDLQLSNPFVLAPLAGVTDAPFRRLCKEQGAALVYTEMISGKGLWYKDKNTDSLLRIDEEEKPVGCQIFGSEPEIIAFAAETLSARDFALLDLNMGCPVPKIVRNGEGSALLKNPDLAGRLVEAAVAKSFRPVTAKIRIGWDALSVNAVETAKTLAAAGAAAIAVHGRTREQYYSGSADWEMIGRVKAAVRIPVIGNGDVRTGSDALRMLRETGCDFVMIARGAMGNPWIFREAVALWETGETPPPVTPQQRLDMVDRHLVMMIEEKGAYSAVREMRKHAGWYLKGLPGAAEMRRLVNTLQEPEALQAALAAYRGTLG